MLQNIDDLVNITFVALTESADILAERQDGIPEFIIYAVQYIHKKCHRF